MLKVDHVNLWRFQAENKINNKDFRLLLEAFRRKHCIHGEVEFYGLGTAAQYRSPLFMSSFVEDKRRGVNNWYKLTDKGRDLFDKMEKTFDTNNYKNELNNFLFTY